MTWWKASPVLALCVLFDVARAFFQWFWFFGPALAAATCTAKWSSTVSTYSGGLLGPKTAALICGSGAVGAGVFAFGPMAALGTVMAFSIALIGWLTIGLILLLFNARIFKENGLWFVASLGTSIIPFIGSIPFMTIFIGKMYYTQIKIEKRAFKKWQNDQAAVKAYERNLQLQQFAGLQAVREPEIPVEEQKAA